MWRFIGITIMLVASTASTGQVPLWSVEDVNARIAELRDFELPERFYIEMVEYSWLRDAERTVRELRDEVDGRPDHPMRREFDVALHQLEHGPDQKRWRFWYWSEDRWRVSLHEQQYTFQISRELGSDGSGQIWVLSNGSLSIYEADNQRLDEFPQLHARRILPAKCRYLIDGGLSTGYDDLACVEYSASPTSWEAVIASEASGWSSRVSGEMTGDGNSLARTWTIETGRDTVVGIGCEYPEWRFSEVFDSNIAMVLLKTYPDGSPYREVRVEEVRPITRDEMLQATRRPRDGSPDVALGEVSIAQTREYTDRAASTSSPSGAAGRSGDQNRSTGWLPPRSVLIGGVILIICTIVVLRVRSSK